MLNAFLFTKIEEEDIGNIWFQQDCATCHTLDVLRPVFEDRIISRRADIVWPPRRCDLISLDYYLWGDRLISRRADVIWPPRSCDLTSLDYYLWGAVKDKCYADKPATIDALKDNIRVAIAEIKRSHHG